jgi:hypothetical protein
MPFKSEYRLIFMGCVVKRGVSTDRILSLVHSTNRKESSGSPIKERIAQKPDPRAHARLTSKSNISP